MVKYECIQLPVTIQICIVLILLPFSLGFLIFRIFIEKCVRECVADIFCLAFCGENMQLIVATVQKCATLR